MKRAELIGQWRAFDRVLMMLNGLDVPDSMTADGMRRKIFGEVMSMQPSGGAK